ncbi:Ycf68 protein, partial [Quillaja saponaria]
LPVISRRKVRMTSSHHAPYALGDTRATMAGTKDRDPAREDRWGDSGEIQCRSNFLFTRGIRAVRGGPPRLLSSRESIHPLSVYGQLSLEHRFRFGLNGKRKTEHLTTYLHRPRTTRSPLSFWGDGGIVPFEPFFHAFPGGLEKIAINRIFLILPSRKEEREILFPFRGDQEIGSSHKKNAWLINNSLLGLRPPQSLRTPPISAMGCVYLSIS